MADRTETYGSRLIRKIIQRGKDHGFCCGNSCFDIIVEEKSIGAYAKMGFFDLGRIEGFPSQYPGAKTPVTADVLEAGLILAFVILGIAFLLVIVGLSLQRSTYALIKVVFSVSIGCCLMLGNFGQEWEIGSVESVKTAYRAGSPHEINASISLKLGLRSLNVTLKGEGPEGTDLENETINYNERFEWTWDQGRIGFGPYAGLLQRSFREAQLKGLPIPILSVVEYFVPDGEGLRYGRFYRTAGWYTHILMWTAFCTWILANIFLVNIGRYAVFYLALTGALQILACIVWAAVRNPYPLVIPFDGGQITTRYGPNYWMVLVCGIVCILLAAILQIMDLRCPEELANFLGIDPIEDYVEEVRRESEVDALVGRDDKSRNANADVIEMEESGRSRQEDRNVRVLVKRSSVRRAQKRNVIRRPQPLPPPVPMRNEYDDAEDPIYGNAVHHNPSYVHQNDEEDDIYQNYTMAVPGTSGYGEMSRSTEVLFERPPVLPKKSSKPSRR